MTELDFPGSNPAWMATIAIADGDSYVINGRKWFTAADGATFVIVMAVTDPNADPHRRASQIIVPCDTPAFGRLNGGAQIYDGPDEVHKSIVARRILRRFGTI